MSVEKLLVNLVLESISQSNAKTRVDVDGLVIRAQDLISKLRHQLYVELSSNIKHDIKLELMAEMSLENKQSTPESKSSDSSDNSNIHFDSSFIDNIYGKLTSD